VAGDFVNGEGEVTEDNAIRCARYLDNLYSVEHGYFLYDKEIDGQLFENLIIPHLSVLGNHETGEEHHIRWSLCQHQQDGAGVSAIRGGQLDGAAVSLALQQ